MDNGNPIFNNPNTPNPPNAPSAPSLPNLPNAPSAPSVPNAANPPIMQTVQVAPTELTHIPPADFLSPPQRSWAQNSLNPEVAQPSVQPKFEQPVQNIILIRRHLKAPNRHAHLLQHPTG